MEKGYVYNLSGTDYNVLLKRGFYNGKNTSLELFDMEDGFPFAKCTVNIPGLEKDEVAIKDYSENEGMLDFLLSNSIVEKPHRYERSGYVRIPVCKMSVSKSVK